MFRGSAGSKQLQAGPDVVDGQWHQVICQRTGNQIVETVDGEKHSFTKATGSITVTAPVRLGSHENGGTGTAASLTKSPIRSARGRMASQTATGAVCDAV